MLDVPVLPLNRIGFIHLIYSDLCSNEIAPQGTPLGGTNDNKAKNLEACIGECDNDGQCKEGLMCFQRTGFTPVPGCSGEGKKDWDYCYDPTGSVELQGDNDNKATNLEACIGECDNDGQCKDGLKCFQRSKGETIPGCVGDGAGKDWDYCYDPTWTPDTSPAAALPACGDQGSTPRSARRCGCWSPLLQIPLLQRC